MRAMADNPWGFETELRASWERLEDSSNSHLPSMMRSLSSVDAISEEGCILMSSDTCSFDDMGTWSSLESSHMSVGHPHVSKRGRTDTGSQLLDIFEQHQGEISPSQSVDMEAALRSSYTSPRTLGEDSDMPHPGQCTSLGEDFVSVVGGGASHAKSPKVLRRESRDGGAADSVNGDGTPLYLLQPFTIKGGHGGSSVSLEQLNQRLTSEGHKSVSPNQVSSASTSRGRCSGPPPGRSSSKQEPVNNTTCLRTIGGGSITIRRQAINCEVA